MYTAHMKGPAVSAEELRRRRDLDDVPSRPQAIREAATALFYERGYHGTSMRDIASALNMRAPSLYNHLESKQQLLQDIMISDITIMLEEFADATATTTDIIEKIRRGAEAHVRHHARYARESRIGNTEIAALEEPSQSRLKALRRAYAAEWRELVEQAVAQGRASTPAPDLAASAIIDMGIGVARWFRTGGRLTDSTLATYYGDFALSLIGANQMKGTT